MKRASLAIAALLSIFLLPAAAQAATGFSTTNVNLRSGPSTWYPAVAVVPAGSAVSVHGCIYDSSWCDVGWGPLRGWIHSAYLAVPYQSRRVIVAHAPWISLPVVTFHFDYYWDRHYRSRPFYRERSHWQRRHRDHWSSKGSGRSGRSGRSGWSSQETVITQPQQIAPQYQPQPQEAGGGRRGRGGRDGEWSGNYDPQSQQWREAEDDEPRRRIRRRN